MKSRLIQGLLFEIMYDAQAQARWFKRHGGKAYGRG